MQRELSAGVRGRIRSSNPARPSNASRQWLHTDTTTTHGGWQKSDDRALESVGKGLILADVATWPQFPDCPLLPANPVNHTPKKRIEEAVFSSSWIFLQEEGALLPAQILGGQRRRCRAP